ncbi:hypothetical protein MHEI_47120 [Mycobacterium heidelbergense]|nr:hypothetical protein MHEI_47120 [Mycobacterium heidelbergense]
MINVESSHLYARFPRFLAEVARVLRPGGHFLYTDVRKRDLVAEWEAALEEAPLRRLSQQAIDAEVMRGLEKTQRMMGLVSHRAPLMLRGIARRIDRMQTSTFYHALRSGDYSYRLYSFVKD